MRRQAGVVLPLFSLRTRRDWGIGQISDLPACAAWIRKAGHKLLQVLPPHELSPGETSPYGALTAFGIDPIFADCDAIPDLDAAGVDAVLGDEGRRARDAARQAPRVDYAAVRGLKTKVLHAAFERFFEREWTKQTDRARALSAFRESARDWLDELALYKVLRESHDGWGWPSWPEGERAHAPEVVEKTRSEHEKRLLEVAYVQWILDEQWQRAREEMRKLDVEIMGDLAFVVGIESADVWGNASQFNMKMSLGAPPDGFSADGQDWGLPPYDWSAMDQNDLAWIRARTRRAGRLYDRFRIDHAVGYYRQWVRAREEGAKGKFDPDGEKPQAERGRRVLGTMIEELGKEQGAVDAPRVIAEDLGAVPAFVREGLTALGIPGYRVIPWERDWDKSELAFRDPKAFPELSVASWSTHDTAPIDAWWDEFKPEERAELAKRVNLPEGADAGRRAMTLLAYLFESKSQLTLVLAQELLGLRDRINKPGTVGEENWTWRLPRPIEDLEADEGVRGRLDAIRGLVERSGR